MNVEDIRFHKKIMNLRYYFSSSHVRKLKFLVPLSILRDIHINYLISYEYISQHNRFWYLYASSEVSDGSAHMRSLSIVFTVCTHRVWMQIKTQANK